MSNIENIITTCVSIGCAETMKALGVSAGELTERQARKTYGAWFVEAVERGSIIPCRISGGNHKWYSVTDILSYKVSRELKRAEIKL